MCLTQPQLDEFKQQLLNEKQQLLQDLADESHATDTVELDQQSVGRLSRMDAMQMQQMAIETQRRNRQHLEKIDRALLRIEKGLFGECQECEEPIALGRLKFDPTVLLCIDCAR